MCGIAGILDFRARKESFAPIRSMTASLRHRGPDDEGVVELGDISLGHTRLSIIDVSSAGRQPMRDATGRYWIVYNGEIYNFEDLRRELAGKYRFASTSDTEALLAGYVAWGEGVLDRIKGMFAFAVWDTVEKTLFLARDRVGEKPLVYASFGGVFYFSSELNSLLKSPIPRRISKPALLHYFNTCNSIPPPLTVYEGVYKLEQAHCMKVSASGISKRKYWSLTSRADAAPDETEWARAFRSKLSEVVQRGLVSDVPIGISLSGGADSSSICALARATRPDIKTFSFVTSDPADPEKRRIDLLVDKLSLDNRQYPFEAAMNIDDIKRLPCDYGEPFAHFPHIYISYLYEKIRRDVKTIVTGNGGDEVLAGYAKYQELFNDFKYRSLQPVFGIFGSSGLWGRALSLNTARNAMRQSSYFTGEFMRGVDFADAAAPYSHIFLNTSYEHYLNAGMMLDLYYYHYHGVVYLHDTASMKYGLELRSPFLDHELMELISRMPVKMLVPDRRDPSRNKYILKKSMEGLVPPELLWAPKMGFGYGVDVYRLLKKDWRADITATFARPRKIDDWIKKDALGSLWRRLDGGDRAAGLYINAFYALYNWYDAYIGE